ANLQELANAASLYPPSAAGLLEFLEHIELDRSREEEAAADAAVGKGGVVTLITLHNTKGLEFRRVIMTGVEQGIFPREDKKDDDLEEERRLFYVGATRAMDELYLSSCAMRRIYGRTSPQEPSLFLREADRSCLRILGEAPYGFAAPGARTGIAGGGRALGSGGRGGNPPAQVSSDGRWRLGDRVFHDDQGYGAVVDIREEEDGPVVRVRFDSGGERRFLSRYQSKAFTRIGDEYA
ncbi:MAG: ATP-dependent helicase, partial [Treponema sp.]|nr:ATP-dependent helicase [Treponema sp.]